jgi:hypothetical protein
MLVLAMTLFGMLSGAWACWMRSDESSDGFWDRLLWQAAAAANLTAATMVVYLLVSGKVSVTA